MAKQVIDIGITGNDGTGDSIRTSFNKVNENFSELYAIFGVGDGKIRFTDLSDAPSSYTANQIIMSSNNGDNLTARTLVGNNITFTETNDSQLVITASSVLLQQEQTPTLNHPLNVNLQAIGRVPYPSDALVTAFNNAFNPTPLITQADLAISKGYADATYIAKGSGGLLSTALKVRNEPNTPQTNDVDYDPTLQGNYVATEAIQRRHAVRRDGDTMIGALTLNDHPAPMSGFGTPNSSQDLQAATKFYVDNSTFTSNVNLYVSTQGDDLQAKTPAGKQGRNLRYAFKTIGAAALYADSLINLSALEPGPYRQTIAFTIPPNQTFSTISDVSLTGGNTHTSISDYGYENAFKLLEANKAFIQAETIAYLNEKYVNQFTYSVSQYQSLINQILTAVSYDLVLGTTFNTTAVATELYGANYPLLVSNQLLQATTAINYALTQITNYSYSTPTLTNYISQVLTAIEYDLLYQSNYQSLQIGLAFNGYGTGISGTEITAILENLKTGVLGLSAINSVNQSVSNITSNFAVIEAAILTGTTPTATFPAQASTTSSQTSAQYLLINNISFIQAELVAFITANYPNNTYNRVSCQRDIKYVIESLVYDMMYGGNSQTVYAALRYWEYAYVLQEDPASFWTTVYSYLGTLVQAVVGNVPPALLYQTSVTQYLNSTYQGGSSQASGLAANVATFVQIIGTVGGSTPSPITLVGSPSTITIQGGTVSVTYPTISLGATAFQTGRTAIVNNTTTLQAGVTTYINSNFNVINDATTLSNITSLFGNVTNLLNNGIGTRSVPSYTSPSGADTGVSNARSLILQNFGFIEDETVGWLAVNYPSLSYNATTFKTNLSYLLEAVCYDITYGGNTGSILAAQQYYINNSALMTGAGAGAIIAGFNYAQSLTVNVIQNQLVTQLHTGVGYPITTPGRTQVINNGLTNGLDAQSAVNVLWNAIKEIAASNPALPTSDITYTAPSLTGYNSTFLSAYNIITNNGATIATAVTNYISSTFAGGFTYNQSHCYSDIGNIIDAACIDLITGGTYQSINAGKSYYKNVSAKSIAIGTQLTETLDGIQFAQSLAVQCLNQTTQTRYQSLVSQVFLTPSTPNTTFASALTTFNTNYGYIISIIKTGFGTAPAPTYGSGVYTVTFNNGGNGYVDQGAPGDIHIIPGKVLIGNVGGANGIITKYTPSGGGASYDTIALNLSQPGFFQFVPTTATGSSGTNTVTVASLTYTTAFNGTSTIAVGMGITGSANIQNGTVVTAINTNTNTITLNYNLLGSLSNTSVVFGETLDYGETVPVQEIVIFVEAGVYYEDYPIKLPTNVSIKGDDFRRTIVRPLDRISQSPWRSTFFYRDSVIDGLLLGPINYNVDYAPSSTATLGGITGNIAITLGSGQASQNWIGYLIVDNATPISGKAVINSVAGNVLNCSVVYPFSSQTTYASGNWHIYSTTNYGRHYLSNPLDPNSTPLNNKYIDVFLCNDATRINNMTMQGHGGFAMVLDPTGQIKTKSPYGQVCSSFSRSINAQRFAGGQFVDGFAGRLQGTIVGVANSGITLTVQGLFNSGLDIRPPSTPCAFYFQGFRYQVNNVVSYSPVTQVTTSTYLSGGASGQNTIVLSGNLNIVVGQFISGTGVPTGAYITAVGTTTTNGTPVAMSVNLTAQAAGTYTISAPQVVLTLDTSTPYYPASLYNNTTCSRDVGLILDAVTWDLVTGSNFQSVRSGLAYLRGDASVVTGTQLQQTVAGISETLQLATSLISTTATVTSLINSQSIINNIIQQGTGGAPTITFPTGVNSTANAVNLKNNLQGNRSFIQSEIVAWIASNYNTNSITNYSAVTCARDVGYIVDSICYDIMYGGNSMTYDAVLSYYGQSVISGPQTDQITGEESVTAAAYGRLQTVLQQIATNTSVTKSSGNISTQITSYTAISSGSTEYGYITSLTNLIVDYVADGVFNSGETRTTPTLSGLNSAALADRTTIENAKTTIQTGVINYLNAGGGLLINIEQGGNKSMLANDFAMINDLGYAILCTNGGVSEQVSTFTYYCWTHYWALNGGQIRSVAGSNAYGQYALRASGYDVTELPDAVNLANTMVQVARVYKQGAFATSAAPTVSQQAIILYIVGYQYIPTNNSELEIDHTVAGLGITRYLISGVTHTGVTISANGIQQNVLQINLSTSGSSGTSSTGLVATLYDGQQVTIRVLSNVKFYNIANVKPTRPSTALQYVDNLSAIYRVISYNLTEATGEPFGLGSGIAILGSDSSFNYYLFTTDVLNLTQLDPQDATKTQGSKVGDNKIAVLQISTQTTIDQINKGTYVTGWNGRIHRIISYTIPTFIATGTYVSYTAVGSVYTLIVSAVAGTIVNGDIVTGTGFNGTQTVQSFSYNSTTALTTIILTSAASGSPSGTITFGVAKNGYLTIDPNPILNTVGSSSYPIPAMTYNSQVSNATGYSFVTYDVAWTPSQLPIVDNFYLVNGQANTSYNVSSQITSSVSKTQITVSSTTGLSVGMVVTCSTAGSYVPSGTIIQSIDSPTQFTVSPACWVPAGAFVSSTIVSVLQGVTITNGGSGYSSSNPPIATVGGVTSGGAVTQAIVSLIVTGGSITNVIIVSPGYGYTSTPDITITTPNGGTGAVLTAVLSATATTNTTAQAGVSINQVTVPYSTLPGAFTLGTSITVTTGTGSATAYTYNSVTGYSATFGFGTTTAPTANAWFKVAGHANPLYNGFYQAISSTTTSVNLFYKYNPGIGTLISIPAAASAPTITGSGPYLVTYAITTTASATSATISTTTLTVAGTVTGTFATGMVLSGGTIATNSASSGTSGQFTIVVSGTQTGTFAVNQPVSGTGVGTGAVITNINSSTLTVSVANSGAVSGTITGGLPANTYWITGQLTGTTPVVSTTRASGGTAGTNTFVVTSATSIVTGQLITGSNLPSGTYVSAISGTTITVSQNFTTGGATGTYNFYVPGVAGTYSINASASSVGAATITGTITPPVIGSTWTVADDNPTSYNSSSPLTVTASSTTSITLSYAASPAAYVSGYAIITNAPTFTVEATNGTTTSLGISKAFSSTSATALRIGYAAGEGGQITTRISTTRVTGHDLLDIGTGGYNTTNYPTSIYGNPINQKTQSNEVIEEGVGRVFYATTDQDGVFRIGRFFTVDQGTGTVTFAASIALSNLDGLGFKRGVVVSSFSTDASMVDNAADEVPVQSAIRGFVDKRLGLDYGGGPVSAANRIGPGYLPLNGVLPMAGNINMSSYGISNLASPTYAADAATKGYVDSGLSGVSALALLTDVSVTTPSNGQGFLYDSTVGKWINYNQPKGGDVTISYTSIGTAYYVTGITVTGSGPWLVTATIYPTQGSAFTTGVDYTIAGDSNSGFNGTAIATASSTSSITIRRSTNPGTYTPQTSITVSGLNGVTGTGPYLVTFNIPTQGVAPQVSGHFVVAGNTNTGYNGVFVCTSSSTTTIQLSYPSNPGVYSTATTTTVTLTTTTIQAGGLQAVVKPYVITDSNISTVAAIQQSKLALQAATVAPTAPGSYTQSSLGLAQFDQAYFLATNGWITHTTSSSTLTGLQYNNIRYVSSNSILGNLGVSANTIQELTPVSVITAGGGLLSASFTGAGVLTQVATGGTYSVTPTTTAGGNSALVQTLSDGGINVKYLQINSDKFIDLTSATSTFNLYTPSGFNFATIVGTNGATTVSSILGTLDTTSGTIKALQITTGAPATNGSLTGQWQVAGSSAIDLATNSATLKSTSLTTGSTSTSGTITGAWGLNGSLTGTWALGGTGILDASAGTIVGGSLTGTTTATNTAVVDLATNNASFKSRTLNAGSSTTTGTITGNWSINGQLQATYSDLAEFYEGDQEYEPGTVLVFGGDKEVTITTTMNDTRSAGVVTTDPAYVMNAEQSGIKVCIALAGRIPCKVIGRVNKGDLLTTSATAGYAVRATNPTLGAIIGKALENKDYGEAGVIQVAVGRV